MIQCILRGMHCIWTLKAPKNLWRINAPEFFYYDGPTLALALLDIPDIKQKHISKSNVSSFIMGAATGITFAQVSRWVAGLPPNIDTKRLKDLNLISVAIAEEIIWRGNIDGSFDRVTSIAGFGVLHYPLGREKAVLHMLLFAFLATKIREKYGLMSSIVFHVFYNFTR